MPKTLYERDMEDSLRQIAVALGVDLGGTPDVEDVIRAASRAGKDAERYRWLRNEAHDWEGAKVINLYAGPDFERAAGEELDAIIDIEMTPKRYVLGAA